MFIHRPRGSANPAVKQRLFDAPRVYTAANAHSFRKERDKEWGTRTPQNQKAQECRLRKAWPAPAQAAQSVYKGRHREWTQKRRVIVQFYGADADLRLLDPPDEIVLQCREQAGWV